MPTYDVKLSVSGYYSTTVTADSEDEAIEAAENEFQHKFERGQPELEDVETELDSIEEQEEEDPEGEEISDEEIEGEE